MLVVMLLNLIPFLMNLIGRILIPILHSDPTSMRDKGRHRSSRIRNEMDLKEPSVRV